MADKRDERRNMKKVAGMPIQSMTMGRSKPCVNLVIQTATVQKPMTEKMAL
jgi:hypothetical protein